MARLSSRGRNELVRLERETDVLDPDDSTDWRRETVAFMSDGKIMRKLDVRFKATAYSPARKHSYGWKVTSKLKAGLIPEEMVDKFVQKHEAAGYTRVETPAGSHAASASERLRIERTKGGF